MTEIVAQTGTPSALRILLVDDEPLLLMHLVDIVEELGHIALPVGLASEALELIDRRGPVDLVITDHSMPDMNGGELARHLKQADPTLPIILASGHGGHFRTDDIDFTLPKPFTFAQVEDVVTAAAARHAVMP